MQYLQSFSPRYDEAPGVPSSDRKSINSPWKSFSPPWHKHLGLLYMYTQKCLCTIQSKGICMSSPALYRHPDHSYAEMVHLWAGKCIFARVSIEAILCQAHGLTPWLSHRLEHSAQLWAIWTASTTSKRSHVHEWLWVLWFLRVSWKLSHRLLCIIWFLDHETSPLYNSDSLIMSEKEAGKVGGVLGISG